MCCGATLGNLIPRLRTAVLLCVINDCIGMFFYGTSAIWGYSRAGLAQTDMHECYLAEGYYGHIIAGLTAAISALGCGFGSFIGSLVFCSLTPPVHFVSRNVLRFCLIVFFFELCWMWVGYAVEVFVGFTLPVKECHVVAPVPAHERGIDEAAISVFYLFCWFFSCSMRATVVFYSFELLYGRHNKDSSAGGGVPQVIGHPVDFDFGFPPPAAEEAAVRAPQIVTGRATRVSMVSEVPGSITGVNGSSGLEGVADGRPTNRGVSIASAPAGPASAVHVPQQMRMHLLRPHQSMSNVELQRVVDELAM